MIPEFLGPSLWLLLHVALLDLAGSEYQKTPRSSTFRALAFSSDFLISSYQLMTTGGHVFRIEREGRALKTAARYVRISRSDQRPALQADETADLIKRRGWNLVETYVDEGVSGSKSRRPELDRMLAAARRREFDVLVVWRSDRLFRSLRDMVNTLAELAALGVEFVSVTEPFDTTTPQGQLLMHLVAAFAEFEREVIRERTRAGIAAARRRGARVGRPPVEVDTTMVISLRNTGRSVREIAKTLRIGATTVHRIIGNATRAAVPKTSP